MLVSCKQREVGGAPHNKGLLKDSLKSVCFLLFCFEEHFGGIIRGKGHMLPVLRAAPRQYLQMYSTVQKSLACLTKFKS